MAAPFAASAAARSEGASHDLVGAGDSLQALKFFSLKEALRMQSCKQ